MHLLSLSGSRNHDGQTARIINAVGEGFIKAGGGTTGSIFLPDLKMERCLQCDLDGWGPCRQTQECVIEDDFANLTDKMNLLDASIEVSLVPDYPTMEFAASGGVVNYPVPRAQGVFNDFIVQTTLIV